MARHDDEQLLNGELARLLRSQGIPADAEQRERGKKMDVVATVDGLRVVLEAETGINKKRQAIRDADARLEQGLTNLVFAVRYPDGTKLTELAGANVMWTLRTRVEGGKEAREGDAGKAQWSEGNVAQLANAVRLAPGSISDGDRAAQQLSEALDGAVRRLSRDTRSALARKLDLPRTDESQGEHDDGYFTAAKRGLLVVATAMLFHHRLREHLPLEAPDDWEREWPPASPGACAEFSGTAIQRHIEAWRGILAVDYRPVFETAIAALDTLPVTPDTGHTVQVLANHISEIAGRTVGLRHDLLGRIFHRVLDTARYDGSYYTSTAAATLLASLAVREGDADWSSPDAIANLRVCDPACGTGTLLMAISERIRVLRGEQGPMGEDAEALLGEALVEDVLWGYDINLTATHMAASTLGMLSPKTQFRNMNVHRTLLGVFDEQPYLGSLEFLSGQPRLAAWPSMSQQVDTGKPEAPPAMDLVIMNPPFTRDSLRHDQFSRQDEIAIKAREKEVLAGQPYQAAARLHSSGGMFTVLGAKMLKEDSGALALVLPTVVATAPGNLAARQFLAAQFHIETVVSLHDPRRIFFSENTNIGEILLVCRRWPSDRPKPPTRFLNLADNPVTPVEAVGLVSKFEQGLTTSYTEQNIEAGRIAAGDWTAVNFLSPYLVEEYRKLASNIGPLPVCELSELAEVGPAGQRIRDSYTKSNVPTLSGRRAFWHHKTAITTTMRVAPDTFIEPKPSKQTLADKYWEQRSTMLISARMRLNTSRVAAVMLDTPVVGSLWVPVRPIDRDPATAQALCLFFNSTPGLLALLGGRSNRVPSRPWFSIEAQRALPIPDFRVLGRPARDAMAAAFQRLERLALAPLPSLANDPVRREIDDAVVEALGLDGEWVTDVRRSLAEEPSVTNQPWRG